MAGAAEDLGLNVCNAMQFWEINLLISSFCWNDNSNCRLQVTGGRGQRWTPTQWAQSFLAAWNLSHQFSGERISRWSTSIRFRADTWIGVTSPSDIYRAIKVSQKSPPDTRPIKGNVVHRPIELDLLQVCSPSDQGQNWVHSEGHGNCVKFCLSPLN